MHALLVCGLIVHAALFGSRMKASAKSARRASASTREMCLSHSVMFRCHSPMVVRSLTWWSLQNFGAIFNGNGSLSFHPCSDPVPEGTVFISAPWMPSPCEGVRLLRSTRETQEVVNNSGPEQEFCLFDHMWKFGTSSANMHNEVAPERGPPPAAVAEERWKLFNLIEEGLTRSDAVASMLREQRVERPGCLLRVRTSCLHVPSYQVFRCCNGPDQEFFLVDQEHHVKRPDFIACGWIAVRVVLPKRQEK